MVYFDTAHPWGSIAGKLRSGELLAFFSEEAERPALSIGLPRGSGWGSPGGNMSWASARACTGVELTSDFGCGNVCVNDARVFP